MHVRDCRARLAGHGTLALGTVGQQRDDGISCATPMTCPVLHVPREAKFVGICHSSLVNDWAPRTHNGTRRNRHSPGTPTTGLRQRENDSSRSTGRSGRQNAATRRNMRRGERVTVQGPVKEQQPDGMSHRGSGGGGLIDIPASR